MERKESVTEKRRPTRVYIDASGKWWFDRDPLDTLEKMVVNRDKDGEIYFTPRPRMNMEAGK